MTLALAAANGSYTTLVADRRLTTTTGLWDDEYPKAFLFSSPHLRLGVAFSSLATASNHRMIDAEKPADAVIGKAVAVMRELLPPRRRKGRSEASY